MLTGCAGTTAHRFAGGLSQAVLDQNDPETVRAGIPAYILLIGGLIIKYPDGRNLLADGARLYSAYAAVFVDDATRAQRLTAGARDYSHRALCQEESSLCEPALSYEEFQRALARLAQRALPILYADATAWAPWLRARSTDPLALADLPRVTAMQERVVALDPASERGAAP